MSQNPKIQIAIVEDNADLGESLREIVDSTDGFACVGLWSSGEEAMRKIEAFRPNVVLMDINLPGISGIEATNRIKKQFPEMKVIIVTVYRNHDKIFAALKAGASGYLLKRSKPAEVRSAITDVLSGGAPMSPEIASRIVESFHQSTSPAPDENNLTPREYEILGLLSTGLANKEIADKLDISWETVRVHVKHIFEKLHVRSRIEAAMKYRDSNDPESWL